MKSDDLQRLDDCLVAEHFWDPVGLAIVEYGYRFRATKLSEIGVQTGHA